MIGRAWRARSTLELGIGGLWGGLLFGVAAIAIATGLGLLLRMWVPALSLGAIYTLVVLPVAVLWGRLPAALVALVSVLVFNFVFLPPVYTFTLSGGENWMVFTVYLITGLLVSDLAGRARGRAREAEQREREAALLAELSSVLLAGAEVRLELPRITGAVARLLDVEAVRIELSAPSGPETGEKAVELLAGGQRVGTLYLPQGFEPTTSTRTRFLPALASVLGIALDRERLAHEALEMEALRRSDLLKTALLRTVSHDLRSPLTAIRASLEALGSAELGLDEGQREALLRSALTESERLDSVVRNLLDLSRLQAGAARPEMELRTIDGVVDQALVHFSAESPRLEISVPPDLPLIEVDPIQMEHALVNLIENALKFSPDGSPVRLVVDLAGKDVLVRIADQGPGVRPQELERIFDPFVRGGTAIAATGAGLGLAIARGFVEANGGRIWAESSPGGGASFVVALPAATGVAVAAEP